MLSYGMFDVQKLKEHANHQVQQAYLVNFQTAMIQRTEKILNTFLCAKSTMLDR